MQEACLRDRAAADAGQGRADRHRDRDPLGAGRDLRATPPSPTARPARAAVRHRRRDGARAGGDGHPSRGPTISTSTSSRPSTTAASRATCAGSRSGTTPGASTSTSGSEGADRASRSRDRMRELLPPLLAALRQLALPRPSRHRPALRAHRDLHPDFPRCGVHEPFGDWRTYADFVQLLEDTDSIVEATQLWWSVRPHHSLRHRRGPDLRRPDPRRRVAQPGRADRRLRRPDRRSTWTTGDAARARCASARSRRTSGARSATGWTAR